ncbi:Upstream activation factor subunit spp27 [Thalictrum thalictroides]|uniref:Upstream activation factor subunit spp27 n=1 Tax=Thalictrum thalictroides TaxID=46969 RepID=A0A7J6WPE4_THATH|nr:Upstream activation factor subunit spp27 [Thalictrum thalictroides]
MYFSCCSAPTGTKRRGGPGGLNKVCGVTPELEAIVGEPALPRTQIVKQLWAYIRKHNLQDPSNKRKIICNDALRLVFETDCTDMFKMNKLLAKHIRPLEPTKDPGPDSKRLKVETEPTRESTEAVPEAVSEAVSAVSEVVSGAVSAVSEVVSGAVSAVSEVVSGAVSAVSEVVSGADDEAGSSTFIISDALARFFGTEEREMTQSEAVRRIWEYIKANRLEEDLNPMMIVCDTKLQELFGCENISVLGISEMLMSHFFKQS